MMKTSVRTKLLAAAVIGCLIVPPGTAFAGPEEAAEYYKQAVEAYQNDEFAKAADLLERAYAEDPDLTYQYNRVLALQAMGEYDKALKILDVYGNPMREDGRFDDVKEIRAQIEQEKAEAEAKAKAEAEAKAQAQAEAGDDQDSKVADGDKLADGVEEPIEPADKQPNILGWSLVGVGAAGLGAATLFGSTVLISDVADRRDCMEPADTPLQRCYGDFDNPEAQFSNDRDTWSTHQTLTWVSLGVGAAALIGGGAILLMDSGSATEADTPVSADGTEVRLTPYVGADGAGGVLHISF